LDNFDPDTWKPTAAAPLPPMESPITFRVKDDPSYWFDTELEDLEGILHTRSLAVGAGPTTIKFVAEEPYIESGHTFTSLIWPDGAQNMPFDQPGGVTGTHATDLVDPGLYAFYCKIHPYMLAAAVIDDPATPGADLGKKLRWLDGTTMPTNADEILQTVRSFFVITEPANWQVYDTTDTQWDPKFPAAPITLFNEDGSPHLIPNLDQYYNERYEEPITLKAPVAPSTPGVGEVFYGSQWEMGQNKTKPGSLTVIDAETWKQKMKVFGPSVDFNNPHNFWSNDAGTKLFSTNWYGKEMTVLDKHTGEVLYETELGPSPSHSMTRSNNGHIMVPLNGGGAVLELDAEAKTILKRWQMQDRGENPAFPHGHWVSGDGTWVVTPNANQTTTGITNLVTGEYRRVQAGGGLGLVATAISNDSKRAYTTTLWTHDLTCVSLVAGTKECPTPSGEKAETYTLDFRQNYNKITGESTGPYGLVPIQTPMSPDDQVMLTVGTVTGNIIVTDPETATIVKTLPCGPGCHGINFGAKKGGGYYGYVTTKFANRMVVVDVDPNQDGDPSDTEIAGTVLTNLQPGVPSDDTPVLHHGQGGNGIEIYPTVYNGMVQMMPPEQQAKLTCKQRDPLNPNACG
jgi:hypothetical protein